MIISGTDREKAEHFANIGLYEQATFFILKDISYRLQRMEENEKVFSINS